MKHHFSNTLALVRRSFIYPFLIALSFLTAGVAVAAWQGPPGAPTGCPSGYTGCDAPLNISGTAQSKTGMLTLSTVNVATKLDMGAVGSICLGGVCNTTWPAGGGAEVDTFQSVTLRGLTTDQFIQMPLFLDYNDNNYRVDPSASSVMRNIYAGDASGGTKLWIGPSGGLNYIQSGNSAFNAPNNLVITGANGSNIPTLAIQAVNTTMNGGLSVTGALSAGSATVGGSAVCTANGANCPAAGSLVEADTLQSVTSRGLTTNQNIQLPLFLDYNDNTYQVDPNGVSVLNDVRANIFYDKANTGYYLDPASVSRLNDVRPTIIYDPDDTGYQLDLSGVSTANDFRANIFYDKQNPSYQVDPNGTTKLSGVQMDSATVAGSYVCTANGANCPGPYGGIRFGGIYIQDGRGVLGNLVNPATGGLSCPAWAFNRTVNYLSGDDIVFQVFQCWGTN